MANDYTLDDETLRARIDAESDGARFDAALARAFPAYSRARLQKWIAAGRARIDGAVCLETRFVVAPGMAIEIRPAEEELSPLAFTPEDLRATGIIVATVYEDEHILVVDKPAGLTTHPAPTVREPTMLDFVAASRPALARLPRGGVVHRLDRDTSGLLVVAKTEPARLALLAQFRVRAARREYLAIAHGAPPPTGVIEKPLARSRIDRKKMAVRSGGRDAKTRFTVEKQYRGFALLRCRLASGRTHQIRAHLEHAGYPLAGDPVYKKRARELPFALSRQALHATLLEISHPQSGATASWQSAPPPDFAAALRALEARDENATI